MLFKEILDVSWLKFLIIFWFVKLSLVFRMVEVIDWGEVGEVGEFGYKFNDVFGKLFSWNEFDDRVF